MVTSSSQERHGGGTWTLAGVTRAPQSKAERTTRSRRPLLVVIAILLCLVFGIAFSQIGDGTRRTKECENRGKTLAAAMFQYYKKHQQFPPAFTVDSRGNPLHSWRTLLLPYLNRNDLYERIRLDEPWDSDFNRQFHSDMPAEFGCSGTLFRRKNQTHWQVLVGPDTLFPGSVPRDISTLTRHSGDVCLFVESTPPVHWMSPQDVAVDDVDRRLGGTHGNEFVAVFVDGNCRILSKKGLTSSARQELGNVK